MRVSYVELFIHCKKVFRACGIPYGCADDGAEVVAWSEFIGLKGMKVLEKEIPKLHASGMKEVTLLSEKDGLFQFDGHHMSAIVLGKLMADFALGIAETRDTVRIHLQNTTRSRLLAQPAHYIALRGKGCLINYKSDAGNTMWILSTPEIGYPVFAEGERAEEIMQQYLTDKLKKYETINMKGEEFWLVCTTDTKFINACVRKLRQATENGAVRLTESLQLKARFEKAFNNGAKIDMDIWEKLDKTGQKTLVKNTEQSQLYGTGEHAPSIK